MGNSSSFEVKGAKTLELQKSSCGTLISSWVNQFGRPLAENSTFLNDYYDKDYFTWRIGGSDPQYLNFDDLDKLFAGAAQMEQIPRLQSPITCKTGVITIASNQPGIAARTNVQVEIFSFQLKMSDGDLGAFHNVEEVFEVGTKKCVCSVHTPYLPDKVQLAKAGEIELKANMERSFAVQRLRDEFVPKYGKLSGEALRKFLLGFMDENVYTCSFMEVSGKPQTFEYKSREEGIAGWEKATERKTVVTITKWVAVLVEATTETAKFIATFGYPSGTKFEFHGSFTFDRQTQLYTRGVWTQTKTAAAQWIENPGDAASKLKQQEFHFQLANSFAVKLVRDEYIPNYGKLSGTILREFLARFAIESIYSSTTLQVKGKMTLYERKTREEMAAATEKVTEWGGVGKIMNYNSVIANEKTEVVDYNVRITYPSGSFYDFQCVMTFDSTSKLLIRSVWTQLLEAPKPTAQETSSVGSSILGAAGSVLRWYGRQVSSQWSSIGPEYERLLEMNHQMIIDSNNRSRIAEAERQEQKRKDEALERARNNGHLRPRI